MCPFMAGVQKGGLLQCSAYSNSDLVQIALSTHLVRELATRNAVGTAVGDPVAWFGAAVLSPTARLIRRQDPEVSNPHRHSHFCICISCTTLANLVFINDSSRNMYRQIQLGRAACMMHRALCSL